MITKTIAIDTLGFLHDYNPDLEVDAPEVPLSTVQRALQRVIYPYRQGRPIGSLSGIL